MPLTGYNTATWHANESFDCQIPQKSELSVPHILSSEKHHIWPYLNTFNTQGFYFCLNFWGHIVIKIKSSSLNNKDTLFANVRPHFLKKCQ